MMHKMKLKAEEFDKIENNKKIIEVRLNDTKRKKITVEDRITFYKLPDLKDYIIVSVKDLDRFNSFEELYKNFPFSDFGYENFDINKILSNIYNIYSPEQEKENGAIAITFKVENVNIFPK